MPRCETTRDPRGPRDPRPSDRAWRGFCATCGSSVCFGFKPRPERTYITVGILDDPDAYPAGFHDYRSERIEWLHVDEQLPDAADYRPD